MEGKAWIRWGDEAGVQTGVNRVRVFAAEGQFIRYNPTYHVSLTGLIKNLTLAENSL